MSYVVVYLKQINRQQYCQYSKSQQCNKIRIYHLCRLRLTLVKPAASTLNVAFFRTLRSIAYAWRYFFDSFSASAGCSKLLSSVICLPSLQLLSSHALAHQLVLDLAVREELGTRQREFFLPCQCLIG